MAHTWADWLHHLCRLGGPPQGTTCERIGYITHADLVVPNKGQNEKWPTCDGIGFITPAAWGVLHKEAKSEMARM